MKLKLFFMIALSVFLIKSYGQIQMNSSGNVGFGTTPGSTYKLYVSGNSYIRSGYTGIKVNSSLIYFIHDDCDYGILLDEEDDEPTFRPEYDGESSIGTSIRCFAEGHFDYLESGGNACESDLRLKENIRTLDNSLDKIMNIRGVKYDFITTLNTNWSESKKEKIAKRNKDRIGFIAQELEQIFPELVTFNEQSNRYLVKYDEMTPILVEAVKEQQSLIENLQAEVAQLKSENNLKSESVINFENGTVESNTLFQNSPNPFSENTEIKYYISDEVENAFINIYDLAGMQIKSIELYQKENGSISINGGEFRQGMYLYTLIADGIVAGTKQMILTD